MSVLSRLRLAPSTSPKSQMTRKGCCAFRAASTASRAVAMASVVVSVTRQTPSRPPPGLLEHVQAFADLLDERVETLVLGLQRAVPHEHNGPEGGLAPGGDELRGPRVRVRNEIEGWPRARQSASTRLVPATLSVPVSADTTMSLQTECSMAARCSAQPAAKRKP